MNKFTIVLCLAVLMFYGCVGKKTATKPQLKPPIASTTDIGNRIERLASDEFQGRAPGTPGGQAASQYIADEMKAAGLDPMGANGSYFQSVELTETVALPTSTLSISSNSLPLLHADQNTNAVYWTKRLDPNITVDNSELVFVGYGVVAPEYGWNDYAGLDVKGKTVVILVNDPGFATQDPDMFRGNSMT